VRDRVWAGESRIAERPDLLQIGVREELRPLIPKLNAARLLGLS
jgi:hypothetical protein